MTIRSMRTCLSLLIPITAAAFLFSWMTALRQSAASALQGQNILLVIAHPDDEVMFFGPTLVAITKPEAKNSVTILCLSNGDAGGVGRVREQELVDSVNYFGIQDVQVLDHPDLPDSMSAVWPSSVIQSLVKDRITRHSIDAIITFDDLGVSHHTNHIAVSKGCHSLDPKIKVYALYSVPTWRKYLSVFDALIVRFTARQNRIVYTLYPRETYLVQKAMRYGHKSQMLWFRWGWILFSRYLIINELDLVE